MVPEIRAAKLVIDDMLAKLGGERADCPDDNIETENQLLYVACRRYRGSARKVMLRWGRYVIQPNALPPGLERHVTGEWQHDVETGEWHQLHALFDPQTADPDGSATLGIQVTVRERYWGDNALVTVWLVDCLPEDERFGEEDLRRLYRLGHEPTDPEDNQRLQARGFVHAEFDLTDDDIQWLDRYNAYHTNSVSGDDETLVRLGSVSETLLSCYMGKEWKERHAWTGLGEAKRGKSFGKFGAIHHMPNEKHLMRVISLAEILYNLQGVTGIQGRVQKVLKDDIESVLGEFEGAQLLYASGCNLAFVNPPQGKGAKPEKGKNYDVAVTLSDGTHVACEIKTKLEITEFGSDTVLKTLNKACDQLPKDRPGVVVIKVPDLWFDQVDAKEMLDEVVNDLFRQRQRVSAVFFHWHLWTRIGKRTKQNFNYHARVNASARFAHPEIANLIRPPLNRYRRFSEILGIPEMAFRHPDES